MNPTLPSAEHVDSRNWSFSLFLPLLVWFIQLVCSCLFTWIWLICLSSVGQRTLGRFTRRPWPPISLFGASLTACQFAKVSAADCLCAGNPSHVFSSHQPLLMLWNEIVLWAVILFVLYSSDFWYKFFSAINFLAPIKFCCCTFSGTPLYCDWFHFNRFMKSSICYVIYSTPPKVLFSCFQYQQINNLTLEL
jgi:hypothetical protein